MKILGDWTEPGIGAKGLLIVDEGAGVRMCADAADATDAFDAAILVDRISYQSG